MSWAEGLLFAGLLDWIVDTAPDYVDADVTVEDGGGLSENTGVYLHVGTADPLATSSNAAANATQEWPLATKAARGETGSVVCSIHAVDEGGDQRAVRRQVVDVALCLLKMMRENIRPIDGLVKTSVGDISFDQGPTDNGAEALLVIHIEYDARIQGGVQ